MHHGVHDAAAMVTRNVTLTWTATSIAAGVGVSRNLLHVC